MSYESIPGWCDFEDIYQQAVDEARDSAVIVEVGVALGRSLAFLVERVKASGKAIELYAVDNWPDSLPIGWGSEHYGMVSALCGVDGPRVAFEKLMDKECPGWRSITRVVQMPSVDAARQLQTFQAVGFNADLVFIDANHTYPHVKQDIAAWLPLVRPGGVLAGHDYTSEYPGVQQAVHEAFGQLPPRRSSWWWRKPQSAQGGAA